MVGLNNQYKLVAAKKQGLQTALSNTCKQGTLLGANKLGRKKASKSRDKGKATVCFTNILKVEPLAVGETLDN